MLPLQWSKHKWYLSHSAALFIIFHGASWSKLGANWEWAGSELEWAGVSSENISLWEAVMVLKGQYIRSSYNNRKYFTLEGCYGVERPIHTIKLQYQKIFHFGRVLWSWKANTYDQATITENISLWEGVWSWKATITENISIHTIKLQ